MPDRSSISRRRVVAILGSTGITGLAGCGGQTGSPSNDTERSPPTRTVTQSPTEPSEGTPSDSPTETTTATNLDLPWQQLPGPPGGPVTDIAVSTVDSDYVYVATITAGLYASSDGGSSWIQGPEARHHERAIVASPHDAKTARTSYNRTNNAGRRWYDSNASQEKRRVPPVEGGLTNGVEYDPFDERILYIGTQSDGLYRSTDGGISWERALEVPGENVVSLIDAATKQEGVVYATLYPDPIVYKSTDHGASWEEIAGTDDLPAGTIRGLSSNPAGEAAFVAIDDQGVFHLGNGEPRQVWSMDAENFYFLYYDGLTISANGRWLYYHAHSTPSDMWDSMALYEFDTESGTTREVSVPEKQASVTAHPSESETLYFGGWSWVWRSDDRGETWTKLSNDFVDRYLSAVGINRTEPSIIIPGSVCSSGIWVSRDKGQTYSWKRSGLRPFHQEGEFAEHYVLYTRSSGSYAYASTRAGLLISEDEGNSWRLLDTDFSGTGDTSGQNPTPLHGLAIDPETPETVYVGAGRIGHGTTTPADFGGSKIWKSTDGGRNWADITDGFPGERDTVIGQILVSQHDSRVVYIATSKKDKFIPDGSSGFKIGEGIGIYRSSDGGATWESISSPFSSVFNLAEDSGDAERLYASTQQGVFRSEDGGRSWERVLPHKSKALLAHPDRSELAFVGANKYENYWDLLVSTDAGETWTEGNLTIQVGREPNARPYDGIDLNADYRVDFGYIMDLAIDDTNSQLFAATRGAGLWRGSIDQLVQ